MGVISTVGRQLSGINLCGMSKEVNPVELAFLVLALEGTCAGPDKIPAELVFGTLAVECAFAEDICPTGGSASITMHSAGDSVPEGLLHKGGSSSITMHSIGISAPEGLLFSEVLEVTGIVLEGVTLFVAVALVTVLECLLFVEVFLLRSEVLDEEGAVIVPVNTDLASVVYGSGLEEEVIPKDDFFFPEAFFQGGEIFVFEPFFHGGVVFIVEAFFQGGVIGTDVDRLTLSPSNEGVLLLRTLKGFIIPGGRLNRRVLLVSGVFSSWHMSVLFLRDFSTTFLFALLKTDFAAKHVVDELLLAGILVVTETSLFGDDFGRFDLFFNLSVLFSEIRTIVRSQ